MAQKHAIVSEGSRIPEEQMRSACAIGLRSHAGIRGKPDKNGNGKFVPPKHKPKSGRNRK